MGTGRLRTALVALLSTAVIAGMAAPAAATPVQRPTRPALTLEQIQDALARLGELRELGAARVGLKLAAPDTEPDTVRPVPEVPYVPWDGTTGVEPAGDPRYRTLVADIAALAEDYEVRDAAAAALAAGTDEAIEEFLDTGENEAQARARARKTRVAKENKEKVTTLKGTGGPVFNSEVERVLKGSDYDRDAFLAYGAEIARARDEKVAAGEKARRDQLRARVQMLAGLPDSHVSRGAKAALAAGDAAIDAFLASGYLEAAKKDEEERRRRTEDDRKKAEAADQLSELAQRAIRASKARKNLMVAHGNGIRALQAAANAMVSAGNEARKAEQILKTNAPDASYEAVKAEVRRQLGYAQQAAERTKQAAASATVEANILIELDLSYGTEWAEMARGMDAAAHAAAGASLTAQHAIDATEATHRAKDAQSRAEAHKKKAEEWRKHAEEHAAAADRLAKAAKTQADVAKNAAERAKRARDGAEKAEAKAWAAAKRVHDQRLIAEAEQKKAAAFRATAERERQNAAAARSRADQFAATARRARTDAEAQAGVARTARERAEAQEAAAGRAYDKAVSAENGARTARNRAEQAERDEETAIAKAQAHEAWAQAAKGSSAEKEARDAANAARGEATTASGAARSARGHANTATGAAANAEGAASEAAAAASRARAAANAAQAAAARADAAADRAEAEAAETHAATLQANAQAVEATAAESQAAEAAQAATRLAEEAANEAMASRWSADRTRDEAEDAIKESISAAMQAEVALGSALAARESAEGTIDPADAAIVIVAPFTDKDLGADFVTEVAEQAKKIGREQADAAERRAEEAADAADAARKAAEKAAEQVKPAYEAAAKAAASSAAAARSAADARQSAADAAEDAAAARAAAARANQADAQARADAIAARSAANAAANDAAIAGRSADAAQQEARAARSAADAANKDAAAARGAATAAEKDAADADAAAKDAADYATWAKTAADNAYGEAVQAQKAADRAEEAERRRAEAERAKQMDRGGQPLNPEDEKKLLAGLTAEERAEYLAAKEQSEKGILDFIKENAGDLIMSLLGLDNLKGCFLDGNVSACIWALVDIIPWGKALGLAADIIKFLPKIKRFVDNIADVKRKLDGFADRFRHMDNAASCPLPGLAGRNSFTAGTRVLLADGRAKPIERVRVGDRLFATDPQARLTAPKRVTESIAGAGDKHLVDVTIDADGTHGKRTATVTATHNHPFWVPTLNTWLDAGALKPGHMLRTAGGTWVQITAVHPRAQRTRVFNLTVADLHTYYVLAGSTPVLVHNCPKLDVPDDVRKIIHDRMTDSGDTVLGKWHPPLPDGTPQGYIKKAQDRGASYYDIGKRFETLTDQQQLDANKYFIDLVAARGERVLFSIPRSQVTSKWALQEVKWLEEHGYQWVNQWAMKKKK